MLPRIRLLVCCLAVLGTVASCARPGTSPGAPPGTPAVNTVWRSCAAEVPTLPPQGGNDAFALPPLRDGFAATAAVICGQGPLKRPDGGTDAVRFEQRADDVAALLVALRLPVQPLTSGACTDELVIAPWFALLDADRQWIRPGIPTDPCGKPRAEVLKALHGLKLTTVSSTPTGEIESAEAAASGCGSNWKNMIRMAVDTPGDRPSAGPVQPPAAGTALRLCVFRASATDPGAGAFERGGLLGPADAAAAVRAIGAAGPATADCTAHADRFALLRAADNSGGEFYVELAGCYRILGTPTQGGMRLAQGDAALAHLLDLAATHH